MSTIAFTVEAKQSALELNRRLLLSFAIENTCSLIKVQELSGVANFRDHNN